MEYPPQKSWHQLTDAARDRMEALLDAGTSQKEIAAILKVHPSTISREHQRSVHGRYDAHAAARKARVRRLNAKYQGMRIEACAALKTHIIQELRRKRSPDEIAGRMRRERMPWYASKNAIYKWLYSVYGGAYCRYLCTQRWRRKPQQRCPRREMIPHRVSIHERPLGATNCTRYGHFEGDTAVAPKRAMNTEALALAIERKSKLLVGEKIPSLAPREMTRAIRLMQHAVAMQSLTLDNGIENKAHERWQVPGFFADPHSPWQKPMIENVIGLLRRWRFPKGTDWKRVSAPRLAHALAFLNHKYRKSLGYQSAWEVARAHGIIKQKYPRRDCN